MSIERNDDMQLDTLWQFMQVDMEADGFETKMRQSSNRQKLIKARDFLKDQQSNMKKLENDVGKPEIIKTVWGKGYRID